MDEELGYIADDLDQHRISPADLSATTEEWNAKGAAHLNHHPDAAQIFRPSQTALGYTAYLSGDGWTVWDHVRDQLVQNDMTERDAVQLADRLERDTGNEKATATDEAKHELSTADFGELTYEPTDEERFEEYIQAGAEQTARKEALETYPDLVPFYAVLDWHADQAGRAAGPGKAAENDATRSRLADEVDVIVDDLDNGRGEPADIARLYEQWREDPAVAHAETALAELDTEGAADEQARAEIDAELEEIPTQVEWPAGATLQLDEPLDYDPSTSPVDDISELCCDCEACKTGWDYSAAKAETEDDRRSKAADLEERPEAADSDDSADDFEHKPEHQQDDLVNAAKETDESVNGDDQAQDRAVTRTRDKASSVADDDGVAERVDEADLTSADLASEPELVASTETTACAIAVTRAHCAVDRAHQQLDDVEQDAAAERDDELARWYADDTAAQIDNEQAVDDSAAHADATVRGE